MMEWLLYSNSEWPETAVVVMVHTLVSSLTPIKLDQANDVVIAAIEGTMA